MAVPESIQDSLRRHGYALPLLILSGSKAYGIDTADSDDDYLGIFLAPLRTLISIDGIPAATLTGNAPDFTLHEFGRFCALALKGNPAALEILWSPDVLVKDEWGEALLKLRHGFLHRGCLTVYIAYAESQLHKMARNGAIHAKGGSYNNKFGAHLIRLLHAGIILARTGEVLVRVPEGLAVRLLDIRRGRIPMENVIDMTRPLLDELRRLSSDNTLPEKPDLPAIDALVVRARLSQRSP